MMSSKQKIIAWFVAAAAAVLVVVSYSMSTSERATQCMSVPCTFYENKVPYLGVCGSREGDTKNCYCFKALEDGPGGKPVKIEGGPSSLQAGCVRQ